MAIHQENGKKRVRKTGGAFMRLQARKPITIRSKVLGGPVPLVCIPIVSKTRRELEQKAKEVLEVDPDVIEWRIDFFEDVCDLEKTVTALKMIRNIIGETPLIFTFRSDLEGGFKKVKDETRYKIIEQVIGTEEIDVVDIELISGKTNIDRIRTAAIKHNTPLVLSYHNFEETPSVEFMVDKMKDQVLNGADIAKIAVVSKNERDVLNLLLATLKARETMPDIPLITMAMGKLGVITRIAGGIFGSDLTFGTHGGISAPGQIPVEELRNAMKIL